MAPEIHVQIEGSLFYGTCVGDVVSVFEIPFEAWHRLELLYEY